MRRQPFSAWITDTIKFLSVQCMYFVAGQIVDCP